MIHPDTKPTTHVSPYQRVEIGPPDVQKPAVKSPDYDGAFTRAVEADRIWSLVVQSAQGNAPSPVP